MKSPSKEDFIETLFEMLDELDWPVIHWYSYDRDDFIQLLKNAWDRAAKNSVDIDNKHWQTLCSKCGQPFTYPEGCTPTECLEGK